MEKALIGSIIAIMAIVMISGVVQGMTPQPQYFCPLCGAGFITYDELYQHFIAEHPAEPIEIIWE